MGLLGKIFDKKECSICGGEIGLLGNRKLEDGNLCKECESKLSPFFSERSHSTVDQIREQMEYREANKAEVSAFHASRTFGTKTKLMIDQDNDTFIVTDEKDIIEANPDVIPCSDVTNCWLDIDERRTELKRTVDGKRVSYSPPKYEYHIDLNEVINVNHPYFDEIRFKLNKNTIHVKTGGTMSFGSIKDIANSGSIGEMVNKAGAAFVSSTDPRELSTEYRQYEEMSAEIKQCLMRE